MPKTIKVRKIFQFHYGTIKRERDRRFGGVRPQFQFHYGTIKSTFPIPELDSVGNFNSTMVRLKV